MSAMKVTAPRVEAKERLMQAIFEKWGELQPSSHLILLRRTARSVLNSKGFIYRERRWLRRLAKKLELASPFNNHKVSLIRQDADQFGEPQLVEIKRILIETGSAVLLDSYGIVQALGAERVCDLLNINPVHRAKALEEARERDPEATSKLLGALVAVAGVEDSATWAGRPREWGEGGPLYQACQAKIMDFIRVTPGFQLPDPFAPGAPFGPKLPPELTLVEGGKPTEVCNGR